MPEKKVSIFNEQNEKLTGIETLPIIKRDKYPAIILVHGFGATKGEGGMFDALAEELAKTGFLVYRFDFSGRGESEGDYSETSLSKQVFELSKILEFVKSKDYVDSLKIGILAQSFGTSVTIALVPKVNAIILMGSICNPHKLLSRPSRWKELNKDGFSRKIKSNGEAIIIGPQFWEDFQNYNLSESIKKIKCLILFIHGSEDETVPLSEMETYFENANDPEKIVIKGADHGLKPHRDKMYSIAVDWFKKHL